MSIEWMKAKAEKAMRDQVERVIASATYPDIALPLGMLEGFYMLGLINDLGLGYWRQRIEVAATERRAELRRQHNAKLMERSA